MHITFILNIEIENTFKKKKIIKKISQTDVKKRT